MDNNQINQQQLPQQHLQTNYADDEIDLRELFGILWAEKWLIIGITTAAAILSIIYALSLTNIYRAEAVLAPAEAEQSSGLGSQFGGAAALLGVNIGGAGGDAISTALATLRSRQFLGRFIQENGLLVPLFAASWDSSTRQSVINEDVYNPITGEWLLENGPPTEHNAYRALSGMLSVSEPSRDTGIVTVAITGHNPIEAAEWVNKLVRAINQEVRARDVREANNAITYLQQQLAATQLVDMQRVFYQLIESQTRITMLADVRDEYVFRVIDPAIAPDQKIAPRRSIISIIGTLLGGLSAALIVFLRRMFKVQQSIHLQRHE